MRPRFCVQCGQRVRVRRKGAALAECARCGWVWWNNPRPTASVLIVRGGHVLLVRRAMPPRRGYWDVPGGFVEPGETAEDAARREIAEELGVRVRDLRLLGIFPDVYGPDRFPTLNLYYTARLRGRTSQLTPASDVASCEWIALARAQRLRMAFRNNREALRALARRG